MRFYLFFLQEAKPSAEDLGDKKEGEYIKLKVIGQVSFLRNCLLTFDGGVTSCMVEMTKCKLILSVLQCRSFLAINYFQLPEMCISILWYAFFDALRDEFLRDEFIHGYE